MMCVKGRELGRGERMKWRGGYVGRGGRVGRCMFEREDKNRG
jgi:hypothetical protein